MWQDVSQNDKTSQSELKGDTDVVPNMETSNAPAQRCGTAVQKVTESTVERAKLNMIELKRSHPANSENRRVQGPWRVTQTQRKPPTLPHS